MLCKPRSVLPTLYIQQPQYNEFYFKYCGSFISQTEFFYSKCNKMMRGNISLTYIYLSTSFRSLSLQSLSLCSSAVHPVMCSNCSYFLVLYLHETSNPDKVAFHSVQEELLLLANINVRAIIFFQACKTYSTFNCLKLFNQTINYYPWQGRKTCLNPRLCSCWPINRFISAD